MKVWFENTSFTIAKIELSIFTVTMYNEVLMFLYTQSINLYTTNVLTVHTSYLFSATNLSEYKTYSLKLFVQRNDFIFSFADLSRFRRCAVFCNRAAVRAVLKTHAKKIGNVYRGDTRRQSMFISTEWILSLADEYPPWKFNCPLQMQACCILVKRHSFPAVSLSPFSISFSYFGTRLWLGALLSPNSQLSHIALALWGSCFCWTHFLVPVIDACWKPFFLSASFLSLCLFFFLVHSLVGAKRILDSLVCRDLWARTFGPGVGDVEGGFQLLSDESPLPLDRCSGPEGGHGYRRENY